MPILKNARHELYAQLLSEGKTASEAIGLAGFTPDPRNTTRLTNHPDISRRVAELLQMRAARSQRKAEYTSEWIIEQLMLTVSEAREEKDFAACNAALKLLGSEKRMFIDRKEVAHGDMEQSPSIDDVLSKISSQVSPEAAAMIAKTFGLVAIEDGEEEALASAKPATDAVN